MKMLVRKMALATSVALATLIAAEAASAQTQRHHATPEAARNAYDAQGNPAYEFVPDRGIVGESCELPTSACWNSGDW